MIPLTDLDDAKSGAHDASSAAMSSYNVYLTARVAYEAAAIAAENARDAYNVAASIADDSVSWPAMTPPNNR